MQQSLQHSRHWGASITFLWYDVGTNKQNPQVQNQDLYIWYQGKRLKSWSFLKHSKSNELWSSTCKEVKWSGFYLSKLEAGLFTDLWVLQFWVVNSMKECLAVGICNLHLCFIWLLCEFRTGFAWEMVFHVIFGWEKLNSSFKMRLFLLKQYNSQ